MSYIITIKEVTREMVKRHEYNLEALNKKGEKGAYVDNEYEEDVERLVYQQRLPELNIQDVISSANSEK